MLNALELIGILPSKEADLMRIVVGDVGINIDQIEHIFEYCWSKYRWHFRKVQTLSTILDFARLHLTTESYSFLWV